MDYVLIPVTQDDMADGRGRLFIQANPLLIVETHVEERCAAPAHSDVDVPPAAVALTYMDVGNRAARWPQRCQFALEQ